MNEFNERERAFEKKFELDQEVKFKIDSRSAKMFAAWAAEQLGFGKAETEAYAKHALDLIVSKAGRAQLVMKVEQDLKAKGSDISRHKIEKEMEGFYLKARDQITGQQKA